MLNEKILNEIDKNPNPSVLVIAKENPFTSNDRFTKGIVTINWGETVPRRRTPSILVTFLNYSSRAFSSFCNSESFMENPSQYDYIYTTDDIINYDDHHIINFLNSLLKKLKENGILYIPLEKDLQDMNSVVLNSFMIHMENVGIYPMRSYIKENHCIYAKRSLLDMVHNDDKDLLTRDVFVEQCMKIIKTIDRSDYSKWQNLSFAIDGKWGVGKTYVLKLLMEKLDELKDEEECFVFYYNCWKYDYYEEPAIAITSYLAEQLRDWFQLSGDVVLGAIGKQFLNIISNMAKEHWGFDIKELENAISGKQQEQLGFDTYYSFRKMMIQVQKQMEDLARYRKVVFIVDELDRCLPEYSIKVLERLHHIFSKIDNVVVIIAVDGEQLAESIKQIYGETMSVTKYLRKFIDFSIRLDYGVMKVDVLNRFKEYFEFFEMAGEKNEHITTKSDNVTTFEAVQHEIRKVFRAPARKESKFTITHNPDRTSATEIRTQERLMRTAMMIHQMGENIHQKEDATVLLFEIIYSYIQMKFYESGDDSKPFRNMLWFSILNDPSINSKYKFEDNDTLRNCLGPFLYDYLKRLREKVRSQMTLDVWDSRYQRYRLADTYINRVYIAFDECFGNKSYTCLENTQKQQTISNACKSFVNNSKVFWDYEESVLWKLD